MQVNNSISGIVSPNPFSVTRKVRRHEVATPLQGAGRFWCLHRIGLPDVEPRDMWRLSNESNTSPCMGTRYGRMVATNGAYHPLG